MWSFFALAFPFTVLLVILTLNYYASPKVFGFVRAVVMYAWFINLSIVILVPVDVWVTICSNSGISDLNCGSSTAIEILWEWTYWSAFFLAWFIVPSVQGFEQADDFSFMKRLKTSIQYNLFFNAILLTIGVIGVLFLIINEKFTFLEVENLGIEASTVFALVTGALLLGFGLVEIPRSLWKHADLASRQRLLSYKVAKVAEKFDDAHQELSTVIVIVQATSTQMSKRDPLRPMMDMIDAMANEDATFKSSGGRLGENDMDYDTDEKSMVALKKRLRKAQNCYMRYKTEYSNVVMQALEVEDSIKNCDASYSGRFFKSSFRTERTGFFTSIFATIEWYWRCVIQQNVIRFFAIIFGICSVSIIFAEATILITNSSVDLSLFSNLIRAAGLREEIVQLLVFCPLVYICVCTYFSIFRLGVFSFYYLVGGQTDSYSLLLTASQVSRYAAPMCFNYLNLIHLKSGDTTLRTTFETRMSSMSGIYPTFGKVYPLCMVFWCALITSNLHNRFMDLFASWQKFKFESDEDLNEPDGLSSTGVIILRRERTSLERGFVIGENVVPLARHFSKHDDLEAATLASAPAKDPEKSFLVSNGLPETSTKKNNYNEPKIPNLFNALKAPAPSLSTPANPTREAIAAKYAALKETYRIPTKPKTQTSALPTSLADENQRESMQGVRSSQTRSSDSTSKPVNYVRSEPLKVNPPPVQEVQSVPPSTQTNFSKLFGFANRVVGGLKGENKTVVSEAKAVAEDGGRAQGSGSGSEHVDHLDSVFDSLKSKRKSRFDDEDLRNSLLKMNQKSPHYKSTFK